MSTKMPKTDFGKRLKSLMIEKGWNQSELARRAGMGRDNISGYINGRYLPNAPHLYKLARALNVEPSTLLPDEEALPVAPKDEEYFEMRSLPGGKRVALRVNQVVNQDTALAVMEVLQKKSVN